MWLNIQDVADRFGVPVKTVRAWRLKHYGPRAAKVGKHLRYHSDDVSAFERSLRDPSPYA